MFYSAWLNAQWVVCLCGGGWRACSSLELCSGNSGLPDDGLQRAGFDFAMVRDRNGDCSGGQLLLHDHVAATLTDVNKSVFCQDGADLFSGQDPELTQQLPQCLSQKPRHEGAA